MKTLETNSVDAIVTDPPYGLSFMGKHWDIDVPKVEIWREAIRVLKPGGHLISFGGTRTYHRMAVAIEDAGFEIRDMVSWVYGSGFPKSLNIGKAVDKLQGNERIAPGRHLKVEGESPIAGNAGRCITCGKWRGSQKGNCQCPKTTPPVSDEAKQWEGWGTALKPAQEPCVLARKPLSEKTVAENVLRWGTGGLNIDGCRVGTEVTTTVRNGNSGGKKYGRDERTGSWDNPPGRFPANLLHDGSPEVLSLFPETKTNSAARFFYCAKASKSERNRGCEGIAANHHPTVKPIALMEYMIKLITPSGGTVLDPFMGSGSTGMAAKRMGHRFIGIELDPEYYEIAKRRIAQSDK